MQPQRYATSTTTSTWDVTSGPTRLVGVPICPDLLRYDQIGEADNARGRVVRAFFYLMRLWPA